MVCRHMSGFADASDVPDAVLGVPACMIPEGAQHMVCVDQDYQHMYEQHQGVPPAWVSQPVSGPVGFGSNQVKQLYRQLNHHCQLMIQIYALTAPNRQHQQTAHTVKELLDTYQVTMPGVIIWITRDFACFVVYSMTQGYILDLHFTVTDASIDREATEALSLIASATAHLLTCQPSLMFAVPVCGAQTTTHAADKPVFVTANCTVSFSVLRQYHWT